MMTLEELSALINDAVEVCEPECNQHQRINAPWLALRAVVELHKPNDILCSGCVATLYENCRTIQAVEKELA